MPQKTSFQSRGCCIPTKRLISSEWRSLCLEALPSLNAEDCSLLLLNGVWRVVPEHREALLAFAQVRHVILCDDFEK
jgi:hypothetical protein